MASRRISARSVNRVKDEVYRQMLRVEAGRSAAQLPLTVALLQAWMTLGDQAFDSDARRWLRSICPVCLRMIETVGDSATSPMPKKEAMNASKNRRQIGNYPLV